MDIHEDLIKWLRTMGYNGEIPENLIGICNNSTKFIWEDLMANVRPKQEAEIIKRNLILNRLKAKPLDKQDDFAYKIKEVEDFRKKIALEGQLKLLTSVVEEKQSKVERLSQNCKLKDVFVGYVKKKIKENEERKYLLDLKKKQLQDQKSQTEETLTKLKNVTPVEREESSSAKEITKTLENCAAKLNGILTESQKSVAQNFQKTTAFPTTVQTRKIQDQSSVATYLSIREKEDSEEITRSCIKNPRDKENIPFNTQQNHERPGSKRRLFDVPQVTVEEAEKLSFEGLSLSGNSKNDQDDLEENNQMGQLSSTKPKKRESLGILSDSCFGDEGNDSFLSPKKTDDVFNNPGPSTSIKSHKSNNSSDSVVFNYNRNDQERQGNKMKNLTVADYFKKELYGDVLVNKELQNLLHENNRELIYEVLHKLIQNVTVEFTKFVSMVGSIDDKQNKINEDDITKLRFIHLQTELKIMQQKSIIKDLVVKIGRRKLEVLSSIKCKGDFTNLQERLEVKLKQVGLDASLAAIKKEINSSNPVENDDNDLQVLASRIMKVKNEIAHKIKLIRLTIEELYKTQNFLMSTRESVLSPIWHIRMLKTDTDWMNPLLENLWHEEILVFESFPLEYQRRCTFTDSKTYYRDLCIDNYPEETNMDPEHLAMLSEILESPFSPPETILLNILKAKMKLEVLRKIEKRSARTLCIQYDKNYSYEELLNQESYLDFAIDKLKAIMFSSSAGKTLSIGNVIRKTMEIWTEMPMKDFISIKRVVDGHTYQFYLNKLNNFL